MAHHQIRSWVLAIFAGTAGLSSLLVAYLALGFATRVIAMCGGAPIWWVDIYVGLAFLLPALSVWFALRVRNRYLERFAPTLAELLLDKDSGNVS